MLIIRVRSRIVLLLFLSGSMSGCVAGGSSVATVVMSLCGVRSTISPVLPIVRILLRCCSSRLWSLFCLLASGCAAEVRTVLALNICLILCNRPVISALLADIRL